MRKLLFSMLGLTTVGVLISSYTLWRHYAPSASAFCNINGTFSCDLVNQSAYSEIFGIPVALIGLAGYFVLGSLALFAVLDARHCWHVCRALLILAIFGLLFSLAYTYIEFFVIGAVCLLCVASQVIITIVSALAAIAWRTSCRSCQIG